MIVTMSRQQQKKKPSIVADFLTSQLLNQNMQHWGRHEWLILIRRISRKWQRKKQLR